MSSNQSDNYSKEEYVNFIKNNSKITKTDSDDCLEMYCYNVCNNDDEFKIKSCRGIVINEDNQILLKSFPYTIEYNMREHKNISENINNINNIKFYDAYEGTLVRMFYYNEKWYITTHRKLDAFKSKWASKESFGEQFEKCINYEMENNEKIKELISDDDKELSNMDKFKNILDKQNNTCFYFLIQKVIESYVYLQNILKCFM